MKHPRYRLPWQTYVNASLEGFIFGTMDVEKDWDSFVEKCENKGCKQLEEMYSEAWANRQTKRVENCKVMKGYGSSEFAAVSDSCR